MPLTSDYGKNRIPKIIPLHGESQQWDLKRHEQQNLR